ncbi:sensor histidine kinase [Bacteroidota bacterium]
MLKKYLNKVKWIPVLMIFSQVLLTAFVIYWLNTQFQEEKNTLKRELHLEFSKSINELVDSRLNTLFDSAFIDSSTHKIYSNNDQDVILKNIDSAGKVELIGHYSTYTEKDSITVSNNIPRTSTIIVGIDGDSLSPFKNIRGGIEIGDSINNEIRLRGIKLFIERTNDDDELKSIYTNIIKDTVKLKQNLAENIQKQGWNFPVIWVTCNDSGVFGEEGANLYFAGKTDMYFEGPLLNNKSFGFTVKKYRPYLFKQIAPQILFAFVLLLLTGAAFFFTYRSLNKEIILNTLRKEFISNISHELKTPVSTVKVALEALQTYDLKNNPKLSNEYLTMATREMDRLDELVGSVLNTSILDNSDQLINAETTDLISLIKEVILRMQFRITAGNSNISFETTEKTCNININKLYVQGVLINLIDNSLKYGSENINIKIGLAQNSSDIYVTVSDNGPGIPEKYISKVFDKFFRVPSDNKHNVKGYGLGLSFAHMVMKQHNGSIELKNLPEGGCSFKLCFPKSKA